MTGKAKWRVESKKFQVVTRFDSLTLEEDREFFVSKERFVEVDTAYPSLDAETKVSPGKREFMRDFDGLLYLWERTDISYDQMVEHLRRYLVEKLMKPTRQSMWVGFNGELDPEYRQRMQNAIDYWTDRGDDAAVHQFTQELIGMENMALMVAKQKRETNSFPSVVVASHPGDFYVGQNSFRKVVTNIGVGGREVADGYIYTYDVVPSSYISITQYYDYLRVVADVNKSEELLQQAMGPLAADSLVAFSWLLSNHTESLEQLAQYLGYDSWGHIELLANEQMLDLKDPSAYLRREEMVQELARRLWVAKEDHNSQSVTDISDVAGTLFAMEYGSVYRGKGADFVSGEIERMLRLVVAERTKVFDRRTKDDWIIYDPQLFELFEYRNRMAYIMQTNWKVQEGMVTGCGGATNFLQGSYGQEPYMSTTYAGFDMMSGYGYQEGTTTVSGSSSTGKYTEYYDYKPGVCAHCHEHKQYVAHPKSPEITCAGWCSECEK